MNCAEKKNNKSRTLHGVLYRGPCEQQSVAALEAQKCFPPYARRIFDVLSLVENHVLPLDTLKVLLVLRDLNIVRDYGPV